MNPWQQAVVTLLDAHVPLDAEEAAHREHIRAFALREPRCFHRSTLPGHITGSAFVVDAEGKRILLHHHRKLDRWLQMGGHDAGEQDAAATAVREAHEESGLTRLSMQPGVLDVDVHTIPARKDEPAHDHLDIRFLVLADPSEELTMDVAESHALRWFPLEEGVARMNEAGARRVLQRLRSRLA